MTLLNNLHGSIRLPLKGIIAITITIFLLALVIVTCYLGYLILSWISSHINWTVAYSILGALVAYCMCAIAGAWWESEK